MNPEADPAARMQREASEQVSADAPGLRADSARKERLREIPSVDEMLGRPRVRALCEMAGRGAVIEATRSVLADVRAGLLGEASPAAGATAAATSDTLTLEGLEARITDEVKNGLAPSLRRVINATGVILHTNLGRAPLPAAAIVEFAETAARYSNLEYDIATRRSAASATSTPRSCWSDLPARNPPSS